MDGEKVQIVSPTTKAHLHLLSRLMYGLRSSEFGAMIRDQAAREEIFHGVQAIDQQVEAQRK